MNIGKITPSSMENQTQFEVKPPSGTSPRPEDTPRTRNLKELRKKRLQYFSANNANSSSTTDSGSADINLNNIQNRHNDQIQEDVRASMVADTRVMSVDVHRSSSRPVSAVSRDGASRDSLQQSGSFYRNPLNMHSTEGNNNGNYRGESNRVGSSNVGGTFRSSDVGGIIGSSNVGSILGSNNVGSILGSNSAGTRASMSNLGGTARREMLLNSQDNQRPVSSSLGFSLPTLPPESNIVSQRESTFGSRTPQMSKANRTKVGGPKGKANPGKPPKKRSPTSSRDSFNNNPMSISGHGVTSSERDQNRQIQGSMIEADYEDDYSELGLSVDQQRFEGLRVDYHIPAFSSSLKPKHIRPGSASGLRASQSMEHFGGLSVSAIAEDLHQRPEVPDRYESSMRKSATHEGLVNYAEESSAKVITDHIDNRMEDRIEDDFATESIASTVDNDSKQIDYTPPNYDNDIDDKPPITKSSNHVPGVPKILFPEKPIHMESTDFEKTRTQSTSESEMTTKSVIEQEFSSNMLQSVLGKDRMARLLKNLEESAWLADDSTIAGSRVHDVTLESFRSETEVGKSNNQLPVSHSTDIDDLGLTTHRPEDEHLQPRSQEGRQEGRRSRTTSDSKSDHRSIAASDSVSSSMRKSTKYSFCTDEIYARATKLSHTSTEEDAVKAQQSAASSVEHFNAKDNQQVSASKSSTFSDFVNRKQDQAELDEPDSGAKFDYVRGIHSVKKEFYKTVAITDSTAVSDNSLSTTKLSPRGQNTAKLSPRGQIPNRKPQEQSQSQGHRRSGSNSGQLGQSSQEEHIEGIRQHVADIRMQQFEDRIKAGMPYTTASIERYFASMEKLNLETVQGFEPVPEPDILETPRGEEIDRGLDVKGTCIGSEHGSHIRNSLTGSTSYEKGINSNPGSKSDSSFKTNFESRPNRIEPDEKKSNIDKALSANVATSKEAASLTQREKWEQFKIDNDKKKLLNDLRNEGSDDDDLFTKVTSVVEDEKMTERFKEVGINFDFLKQKQKSQSKRSSCSSEMDVVSSHSSEESLKFATAQNNSIEEGSIKNAPIPKTNNNMRENVKPVTPRKNNNVGAKSSKKAEMNGTESSPKMAGVGTNVEKELTKKAEIVTKKTQLEPKNDVDDEVEILFRMSPREKSKSTSVSEKQPPGPTLSGEPTASKSALLLQQGDSFDSSVNLNSSTSSMSQVKVCPECAEVNKIYVTWCVECGAVLSGVDPVPCKGKRDVSRQLGVSTSTSLSQSATNFKNRLEESMYNPSGASSLSAAWMQQSQGKLSLDKSKMTPEKHQEAETNKDVLSLKLEGGVRDSDDFEYEIQQSPVRNLPKSLQSELSLDLSAKLETSNKTAKPERNSASDQLAELSEAILFEYSEVVSPKKFLPPALQEELNLNLSLDGSQTTASLRGISMAGPSWMNKSGGNTNNNHVSQSLEEEVEAEDLTPKAEDCGQVGMAVQASNVHQVAAWAVQAPPVAAQANVADVNDDVADDPDEDEDNLIDMIGQDVEQEDEARIIYDKFVQRLRTDSRFKPTRPQSALQPTASSGRPKTAAAEGRRRPQSAHTARSKVRSSIENPGYQRKWGHSSTLAWNSKSHGEVQPRSSLKASIAEDIRLSSSLLRNRPGSAVRKSSSNKPGPGGDGSPKKSSGVPGVSKQGTRQRGKANESAKNGLASSSQSPKESMGTTQSALYSSVSGSTSRPLKSNLMNTYAKYFEMSPRIAAGEFSQWLCLPDEIWLHVCMYLRHKDLSRVAQTCMQLHRVALDESLWKTIVVKKNHKMIDEWLSEIGRRQPASLSLVQCHGEKVSAHGLRELFRQCSDSLKELNFTGCSRGEMKGDNILLHAASRCTNITHFDASWSNVNDHGVIALIEASHRLESVCLNGCQVVTDEAIHALVTKHGKHLKTLELFGCFNMTPRSAASIASSCKALTILNLGQCWKLTDASISRLAPSLTEVINLDLRGCKQMKDTTLHHLMNYCKKLQSLSIANCPNLTDVSLTEIATYCSGIQSLDLCGCKGITDMGVRALAMACQSLEYLDVSSSAITHKSVSTLASYCHARLEVLKLNFCKHISVPSLVRLAKNCKKLAQLYLYGVDGLRHIDQVRVARPGLWIQI